MEETRNECIEFGNIPKGISRKQNVSSQTQKKPKTEKPKEVNPIAKAYLPDVKRTSEKIEKALKI